MSKEHTEKNAAVEVFRNKHIIKKQVGSICQYYADLLIK